MTTTTSQPRSRGWILYFVVLFTLAITGIILPIMYNVGLQLRPEQLAEARALWAKVGPKDYDLSYSVRYDNDQWPERHIVLVREGEVVLAMCEGEIVFVKSALAALTGLPLSQSRQGQGRDIPALFHQVEQLLIENSEKQGRNFLVANFDSKQGYPRRFIRRVRSTRTREEWNIVLWRAGELAEFSRR